MKAFQIHPLKKFITAELSMPGSKSFTARALVAAALADGESILSGVSNSEDSAVLMRALKELGVEVSQQNDSMIVKGTGGKFKAFRGTINVRDAGTAMRFLTAVAALVPGEIILDGSERMRERPIGELVDALRSLGADIDYCAKEGFPPLKVRGSTIEGGHVALSGEISSQYITALLLIAPLLHKGMVLDVKGQQVSPSYIDMTLGTLKSFGVAIQNENYKRYAIAKETNGYTPARYHVEGDASGASYFWAIAALTKSTIRVKNIDPLSSQGDVRFPDLLEIMGCRVIRNVGERWIEVSGVDELQAITADMASMPDTAQTLAVVASFARGTSTLSGLSTLQIKETKRLTALKNELEKMGISSEVGADFITIHGGHPQGATIATYGDHRMAMSFAVAGGAIEGVQIEDPDIVRKSFPDFWRAIEILGLVRNTL